ncbi:MAG: hypothetical protein QOE61_7067 [Micromonosporaceae bacterium]|jgi:hypothetical protein|nr:hypothetical protein [Micromonosporaceae bacterium]
MAAFPTPQRDLFQLPDPPPSLIPRTLAPEITVLLRELMLSVVSDADVEQRNE